MTGFIALCAMLAGIGMLVLAPLLACIVSLVQALQKPSGVEIFLIVSIFATTLAIGYGLLRSFMQFRKSV